MRGTWSTWDAAHWRASFFTIWTGQALSLVGSQIARFALIWWLTERTGSATVLALATLFATLPRILLGPFAGVYVDRWNRRATLIVADSAIAAVSLWLAYLFWSGRIAVWHVYVIMLAREMGGLFHWPTMQATTALMVPKRYLARVGGLNQAMLGALDIVGPALGALLLALVDVYHIMLLDVVTAAFAVGPLFLIAIPQPERITHGSARSGVSLWGDLRDGLRYLLAWRGLMILIGLAMLFKIALTPAFALLPLLVTDHFRGEAAQLATLQGAFGVGVVVGGVLLSVWGGFRRNTRTIMLGITQIGAAMLVLGIAPAGWFVLGVAVLFLAGTAEALADGALHAVLQGTIDPELQGRVFTLIVSLLTLTSPIGLAIAGPVTDWIGIQVWYGVAGVLCIVTGLGGQLLPALMHLEDGARQTAIQSAAPEASDEEAQGPLGALDSALDSALDGALDG